MANGWSEKGKQPLPSKAKVAQTTQTKPFILDTGICCRAFASITVGNYAATTHKTLNKRTF